MCMSVCVVWCAVCVCGVRCVWRAYECVSDVCGVCEVCVRCVVCV